MKETTKEEILILFDYLKIPYTKNNFENFQNKRINQELLKNENSSLSCADLFDNETNILYEITEVIPINNKKIGIHKFCKKIIEKYYNFHINNNYKYFFKIEINNFIQENQKKTNDNKNIDEISKILFAFSEFFKNYCEHKNEDCFEYKNEKNEILSFLLKEKCNIEFEEIRKWYCDFRNRENLLTNYINFKINFNLVFDENIKQKINLLLSKEDCLYWGNEDGIEIITENYEEEKELNLSSLIEDIFQSYKKKIEKLNKDNFNLKNALIDIGFNEEIKSHILLIHIKSPIYQALIENQNRYNKNFKYKLKKGLIKKIKKKKYKKKFDKIIITSNFLQDIKISKR